MPQTLTGAIVGNTITLDNPRALFRDVPREECRVRVAVEPLDWSERELSAEEHAQLWDQWELGCPLTQGGASLTLGFGI
jgi:hypothetical protein